MNINKIMVMFSIILILLFSSTTLIYAQIYKTEYTRIGTYGTIEVNKCEGFIQENLCNIGLSKGDTISKYTLDSIHASIIDAEVYGTVVLFQEQNTLLSHVEFLNRKNQVKNLNYKIYILTKENYDTEKPEYKYICKDNDNRTGQNCYYDLVGYQTIKDYRDVWKQYDKKQIYKVGTYRWKIELKKNINEDIDFIIVDGNNVKLKEWAWIAGSWTIRRQISNVGTGTYIRLSIPFSSSMDGNFKDVRFTTSDQQTELAFVMVNYTANHTALFNVKNNGNDTIYIYYGNPSASTGSNLSKVYGVETIGYYAMENSVSPARDVMGLNNLTHSGTISWIANDKFNATSYFPSPNTANYMSTSGVTNYPTGTNPMSISFWMNMTGARPSSNVPFIISIGNCASTGSAPTVFYNLDNNKIYAGYGGGNWEVSYPWTTVFDNKTRLITVTFNNQNISIFENSTLIGSGNTVSTPNLNIGTITIGKGNCGGIGYTGTVDEILTIAKSLSQTEVAQLNSFTVPNYLLGNEEIQNQAPIITLNTPNDGIITTNPNVIINCSSVDDAGVTNLSLYIGGALNLTVTNSTANINLTLQTDYNYPEGVTAWYCTSGDSDGQLTTSLTRTFTVDYTAPVVNITYPLNEQEFLIKQPTINLSFNATAYDNVLLSICGYSQTFNTYYTACGQNRTFNLTYYDHVDNTITYFANDTANNLATISAKVYINKVNDSLGYFSNLLTETTQTIYLYLNASDITTTSANLTYNNTIYPMTLLSNNGVNAVFELDFITPTITSNQIFNFYANYTINGNRQGTNIYSQTVYTFLPFNISTLICKDIVYNFSLYDETNLTELYNSTVEYNFYYGTTNNQSKVNSYGKLSLINNFYLCANFTISPYYNISLGEIVYYKNDYSSRRYYIFNGTLITNSTSNISLYNLATTSATSYLLTVESTSLIPYTNKYVRVLRWYPDLNEYKTVEMSKTDDKGQTVIHVKTEDIDYRIGVYEPDGTLIKLASPIRMVCLTSPCSYSLKISPEETDYISFLNIDYTFNFNETTNIWTFIFSDSSGQTDTMNLSVYWINNNVDRIICNNYLTASVGSLTCNTTGYTGILKGIVTRSASPPIVITQKIINTATTAFKSEWGLWLSLLLLIPIILIFSLISPTVAIVGGVIALIPALYFGSINIAIFSGIILIAGIVIHFLRRIS